MCIFLHWFGENWLPLLTIHLYSSSIFKKNKVISELQVHNTFKNKPTNESNNIFVYNYFFVISLRMYGQNTECKSCLESWLHPQCGLLSIWNTARLTLFLYLFHVGSFSLTFFFFFWVVKYQHDYKCQRNTENHTQRNPTCYPSDPFSSSHSFNSGPNHPHR